MAAADLYIVGAGGFGRETLDALLAAGQHPTAFLDEGHTAGDVRGLPVLHPDDAAPGARFVIGIADPQVRRRLAGTLTARGLDSHTVVVHPAATIAPETTVGAGSVILAHAYISSSVRLGRHVQINYGVTVGHDAVLEDFVTVYPGANVAGSVRLEADVSVGANACTLQGLRVGQGTFVGAGAVVTRDLDAHQVAIGVPAEARPRS